MIGVVFLCANRDQEMYAHIYGIVYIHQSQSYYGNHVVTLITVVNHVNPVRLFGKLQCACRLGVTVNQCRPIWLLCGSILPQDVVPQAQIWREM